MSWFARSLVGRFLNTAIRAPVRALRPAAAGKQRRVGGLLPHQWFLALGTGAMLCVPHEYWNNLYGVLFALTGLVLYVWDCAAADLSPENPALLGGGVWLFLLLCVVSPFWSAYPADGARVAVFLLTGFGLSYLTAASFREAKAAGLFADVIFAALILTSLYGLARHFLGQDSYGVPIGETILGRLGSTLEHAINYSEFIAMALPLCLIRSLERRGGRRALMLGLLLLPCGALGLTYARTGWIAAALALAVLLWYWKKWLLIPAAAVGGMGVFLLPGSIQARLLSMLQFNDTGSSGRFTLWRECAAMLRRYWLIGTGLGSENFHAAYEPFSTQTLPFQPAHANMGYLVIWLSLGIVGLGAFLVFYFGIFPRLGKAAGGDRPWRVRALTASLAGAALANIPEHVWFYPRILFFWCVVYGLALAAVGAGEEGKT